MSIDEVPSDVRGVYCDFVHEFGGGGGIKIAPAGNIFAQAIQNNLRWTFFDVRIGGRGRKEIPTMRSTRSVGANFMYNKQ